MRFFILGLLFCNLTVHAQSSQKKEPELRPTIDSITYSADGVTLQWSLPGTTTDFPSGGYNIIVEELNLNDSALRPSNKSKTVTGTVDIKHIKFALSKSKSLEKDSLVCFEVQARWHQFYDRNDPKINKNIYEKSRSPKKCISLELFKDDKSSDCNSSHLPTVSIPVDMNTITKKLNPNL